MIYWIRNLNASTLGKDRVYFSVEGAWMRSNFCRVLAYISEFLVLSSGKAWSIYGHRFENLSLELQVWQNLVVAVDSLLAIGTFVLAGSGQVMLIYLVNRLTLRKISSNLEIFKGGQLDFHESRLMKDQEFRSIYIGQVDKATLTFIW